MTSESVFQTLVANRKRLLEQLDLSRSALDDWLNVYRPGTARIADLARLEGLLAERRDQLAQLLKLDDALMDYLVSVLSQRQSDDDA
jgi:hypothetical protein